MVFSKIRAAFSAALTSAILFATWATTAIAAVPFVQPELPGLQLLVEYQDRLAILLVAGFAGAFCTAFWFPKETATKRFTAIVLSSISAMFVGGAIATGISAFGVSEFYAFLFAGFVAGTADPMLYRTLSAKLGEKVL